MKGKNIDDLLANAGSAAAAPVAAADGGDAPAEAKKEESK